MGEEEGKEKIIKLFSLGAASGHSHLESEEMTFTHQLPVGLQGPCQLQQHH